MTKRKTQTTARESFDIRGYTVSEAQAWNFKVGRAANPKDVSFRLGDLVIGAGGPVFIAGPCAVEGEKSFLSTVEALVESGIKLIRANLFKFRTLTTSFQGMGEKGIDLLARAKEKFGVRLVTEVTEIGQIKLLAPVVDVFQVGSRSMMNTSLLKALGRLDHPVLFKRGFSATLGEYLAAAEYIAQGGNLKIILCERGIRTFEPWLRFTLDIPGIALLRKVSPLPVIADISHGLGRTDIALPMARAALAAGAAGLMVEVHSSPKRAKSDARQQMTPGEFVRLLKNLAP